MRRVSRWFLPLTGLVLALGCSTLQTNVDYDGSVDFSKYRTFTIKQGTPAKDTLTQQRIEDAIAASLQSKGLQRVPDGGELLVYTHVRTQNQQQIEWTNYGYAGWGWGWGWGPSISTVDYNTYITKDGTLVVELANPKDHQLLWRGSATATISDKSDKNIKTLNKALDKMFKNYPPQEKK